MPTFEGYKMVPDSYGIFHLESYKMIRYAVTRTSKKFQLIAMPDECSIFAALALS